MILESSHPQAQPVRGDLATVDLARLDHALDACDFLLEHLTSEGRYEVEERWGPEGEWYLVSICRTLLEAYRITGRQKYLDGAATILNRLQQTQMPAGGWALKLGPDGLEFKAAEEERRLTWERENLPMIGNVTHAVAKYRRLTGDDRYNGMVDRALEHLFEHWDPENGCFVEKSGEHFVGMRSAPTAYQAYFLLGLVAWRSWSERLEVIIPKLVGYVRRNFESFDEYTMPLMRANHAILLMKHRSLNYMVSEIKPRIDRLAASPVFKCPGILGGYGHRDSYRGIVNTEANMRGSGALAIAMKFYDLTTGTTTYRDSDAYRDVTSWIDSMKAERGYYEYQTEHDGKRKGRGSPAQYIPCRWIFGQF